MLKGSVCNINELSQENINLMFGLMQECYDNIKRENFVNDLIKKNQVIILKDEYDGVIKGFSTVAVYNAQVDNKSIKLLFSGDTVIKQEFWAKNDFLQVWVKNAIKIEEKETLPLYWLLMSKGYKTYKYLSTFFNEFYPRYDKKTPEFEQNIINYFGEIYYKNQFKDGIIVMNRAKDYLKEELCKIPERELKDKNIEFFAKVNSEFYKGNELVCVARLSKENLNKAGRRALGF